MLSQSVNMRQNADLNGNWYRVDNIQLGMHGSGPENSMAMIHLDFFKIKDISYKMTPEDYKAILSPPPDEEVDE